MANDRFQTPPVYQAPDCPDGTDPSPFPISILMSLSPLITPRAEGLTQTGHRRCGTGVKCQYIA